MLKAIETIKRVFDFEITKEQLQFKDQTATPMYGLRRSDTGQAINVPSVSEGYEPHTTEDIVALVQSAENLFGCETEATCYFDRGHYVVLKPSNDVRRAIFGSKYNMFPRMVVRARYNGLLDALGGAFVDGCTNLIMMQAVHMMRTRIRHTHSLITKMDALKHDFSALDGNWERITEQAEFMQENKVNFAGYLDDLYGAPDDNAGALTRHKNRTRAIMDRMLRERFEQGRGAIEGHSISGWEAYNAVQGYIQHDSPRNNNPSRIARAMLAIDSPIVKKAELLALQ